MMLPYDNSMQCFPILSWYYSYFSQIEDLPTELRIETNLSIGKSAGPVNIPNFILKLKAI